ncbi:uroporphyrinogen-III synthase [Ferruginibacter yonginensis]|uniref:Uroporphyrinogen-III synthase n=1 Tax=Ferruginibacter yonginensis TaxID=1310416 RepID=A0ABV8QRU2_9BACT
MITQATILSTKKLLPAVKNDLQQHHFNVIDESFISFKNIVNFEKSSCINVADEVIVFTSVNAVKAYIENVQHFFIAPTYKRVYCLSGQTLIAAKQLSNITIEGVAENALALARLITADKNIEAVTFFCGDHRRDDLQHHLQQNNVLVNEVVLYESILTPLSINEPIDGLLFFSPSAIDSYLLKNTIAAVTACFCIGDTTAQHLQQKIARQAIVAAQPSQEAIATCVYQFYNKKIA